MAEPTPGGDGRISVSRDALRAELAQMELRLIQSLATRGEVEELRKELDRVKRRQDDQAAASEALAKQARERANEKSDSFTKREKVIGLVTAVLAIALQALYHVYPHLPS